METYLSSCKHGNFLLLRADFISNCMALYGEWAEKEVELFKLLINQGDTVVEIGSNIGTHSIPIARQLGANGRLYCVEAQRIIFQILNANIALNNLGNVRSICAIASDRAGTAFLDETEFLSQFNHGAYSVPGNLKENNAEYTRLLTLDDLVSSYQISQVDFLKVDVEGMEESVLKGGVDSIRKFKPFVFFECGTWQDPSQHQKGDEMHKWIASLGYKLFWYNCLGFNPDNFRKYSENKVGPSGDFNILAVPNEKNIPLTLPEVGKVAEIALGNFQWINS